MGLRGEVGCLQTSEPDSRWFESRRGQKFFALFFLFVRMDPIGVKKCEESEFRIRFASKSIVLCGKAKNWYSFHSIFLYENYRTVYRTIQNIPYSTKYTVR